MSDYKIWKLTNYEDQLRSTSDDPRQINYKTGLNTRLHPEYTFDKGELTQVKYFETYGDESSLVLCVDITWERDETKNLTKRTETRKYVIESEGEEIEFGPLTKISEKFYDAVTGAKADVRRRSNIVDNLIARAERFGVLSFVQTMFRSLDDDLNSYKATGDSTVLGDIDTYEGAWLETPVPDTPFTLRQLIIYEMTV